MGFILQGAYAKVYLGHKVGDDKQLVALKIMPKFKNANKAQNECANLLKREKEIPH